MAKAAGKGTWIGDYIKNCEPEPVVRIKLDRGELRYTWIDPNGDHRSSDDSGRQPPKGWWLRVLNAIDCEKHSATEDALTSPDPTLPIIAMYHVRIIGPVVGQTAQKTPRPGRPSSSALVVEEAKRRLEGPDRSGYIRRGRKEFLDGLLRWLRGTHKEAKLMSPKTIGGHLRNNEEVRALMPKGWYRQT